MRYSLTAMVLATALTLSSGVLLANSHKPGKHGGPDAAADVGVVLSVTFDVEEARLIRDYFSAHPAEVKPLPPGIAKNLARGKPLPPGIAKRYLPGDLSARLPLRSDYERLIVGDDVLLVAVATGIVVDIIRGVL